jgi:hypothetical protein
MKFIAEFILNSCENFDVDRKKIGSLHGGYTQKYDQGYLRTVIIEDATELGVAQTGCAGQQMRRIS